MEVREDEIMSDKFILKIRPNSRGGVSVYTPFRFSVAIVVVCCCRSTNIECFWCKLPKLFFGGKMFLKTFLKIFAADVINFKNAKIRVAKWFLKKGTHHLFCLWSLKVPKMIKRSVKSLF